MEKAKVIFKKEYNPYWKRYDVFAVFPEPEFKANYGKLQAYTSEGWAEIDYNYYATAKKATAEEYADMLEILTKMFDGSDGDEPLEFVVARKISSKMYDELLKMWNGREKHG